MTVKLYTSKDCGYCEEAKEYLRKKGIKFQEVSVDNAEGSKAADNLGITHVPTLVKDGKVCEDVKKCA